MATKGLGNETLVTSILRSNTVLVEVGGSVRRITVENFMNAINNGDEQMLRQVAWGIPIKQSTQSSTNYGVIGNTAAWTEYKLYCGRYLVTNDGSVLVLTISSELSIFPNVPCIKCIYASLLTVVLFPQTSFSTNMLSSASLVGSPKI